MHRTPSESAASAASANSANSSNKLSRFSSKLRLIPRSSSAKDDRPWHRSTISSSVDHDAHDSSLNLRSSETHASSVIGDSNESSYRQLQALIQRMRNAPSDPGHVDAAYKEFSKIRERCSALCHAILHEEVKPSGRHNSNAQEPTLRRESSVDPSHSPVIFYDQRSSFSGRSLTEVAPSTGRGSVPGVSASDQWLGAIQDWRACLEQLAAAHKISLADTYKNYEREATTEMVDALFASKKFRREAISRMRNASVTRVMSADPQFFPRYDIRFRNYEKVKEELRDIRGVLQSAESGISPDRRVEEFDVSARGDAVLEFANLGPESAPDDPVLRFRVSSYMLAETSPIFARMFSGHSSSLRLHDDEDITGQLPPPPTGYVCKDGSEAKLYRMPQHEVNKLDALEILLHAAHMHNEKVPREVSFEQFVALAECSLQYKSTSPLELVVEHRWLPQWMHKGADDMPDGLLVISYAFGLRQLFRRMSKSAILNLVDEADLESKPWPRKIREKIWAVRCAKVAQVYACCTSAIQEYIRPSCPNPADEPEPLTASDLRNNNSWFSSGAPPKPASSLTSTPRCPKGSHWCDATNLGWMMLVLNEMGLLPHVLQPGVLSDLDPAKQPSRSLAQVVDGLRRVPSPLAPVHPGSVCDPCQAFRAALNDVFNTVSGLTLFDVSGKSHGWALSKHRENEPQQVVTTGLKRMAATDFGYSVAVEFPDPIRLAILGAVDSLDDLHAAAMTNRAFYDTYKTHELRLMRNILRADRIRTGSQRRPVPKSTSNAEEKVLKSESDGLKVRLAAGGGPDEGVAMNDDEGEEESDADDVTSDSGSSTRSISTSMRRERHFRTAEETAEPRPRAARVASTTRPSESVETARPGATSNTSQPAPAATTNSSRRYPIKPDVVHAEHAEEPPLTDEEARRILWPETDTVPTAPPPRIVAALPPPGAEGPREKFRVGDPSFAEGLEEKTLVVTWDKQLRSEHDRQVGILKKGDGEGGKSGKGDKGDKGEGSGGK